MFHFFFNLMTLGEGNGKKFLHENYNGEDTLHRNHRKSELIMELEEEEIDKYLFY